MIQRRKGSDLWDVSCDSCSTGCEEILAETFRECVDEMKRLGWLIVSIRGDWEHYCGDCRHKR